MLQAGIAISYLKSATIHGRVLDLQRSKYRSVLPPTQRHEMCLFKQYSLARQPNGGRPPKLVHAPCRTLFYFNAPPRMTERALRDLLLSAGGPLPLAITVINNEGDSSYAGGGRGGGRPSCGFFDYENVSVATGVIMLMNNTEYNGFTFRVAYASKERLPQSAVEAAIAARAAGDGDAGYAGQKRRRSPSQVWDKDRNPREDGGDSSGAVLLSEQERGREAEDDYAAAQSAERNSAGLEQEQGNDADGTSAPLDAAVEAPADSVTPAETSAAPLEPAESSGGQLAE